MGGRTVEELAAMYNMTPKEYCETIGSAMGDSCANYSSNGGGSINPLDDNFGFDGGVLDGLEYLDVPEIGELVYDPEDAWQELVNNPAINAMITVLSYVPVVGDIIGGVQLTMLIIDQIKNGGNLKELGLAVAGFIPYVGDVIGGVQLTQELIDKIKKEAGGQPVYDFGSYQNVPVKPVQPKSLESTNGDSGAAGSTAAAATAGAGAATATATATGRVLTDDEKATLAKFRKSCWCP